MASHLHIQGVVVGYGWGDVLKGVDLEVAHGQITCIIGPNGAGKSTLLKTISGVLRPTAGKIEYDQQSIIGSSPGAILRSGIVQVTQERSVFPQMTVWDNLLMGGYILRDRKLIRRRADEVSHLFPTLLGQRRARAGALSGGQQRMLEIARSLMLSPKVVLMDEISLGLDPRTRVQAFEFVKKIKESGATVLLVEQNARAGLAIADVGVVMESGKVRLERPAAELLSDPEVARLYLGQRSADPSQEED
ncbi:MAG TPA: ABC transporter ATP-binding protein [Candidatus Dormibacteraeota bacterium]